MKDLDSLRRGMVGEINDKFQFYQGRTDSEVSLFLRVMDQAFTVVNKIEPVSSSKPLEIFYHVPYDDAWLAVIKKTICLAWLNNIHRTLDFHRSVEGRYGMLGSDFYNLRLPMQGFATPAQRDQLWDLGINPLRMELTGGVVLGSDMIWRGGQRVRPVSYAQGWRDRATVGALAQEICYADILEIEHPEWAPKA